MLSVGKVIETKIARLNTPIIDNDAYVKHVIIESTRMRKSFLNVLDNIYTAYVKVFLF